MNIAVIRAIPPSLSRNVLIAIVPYGEIYLLSKEEPLLIQKVQATEIQGYTIFVN